MICPRCSFDPSAVVTASWSIHIDREVKSGNAHVFNVGASRWSYKRDRDAWQWEFRAWRLGARIPSATGRRRVTLIRHYTGRQRPFDGDNLQTGLKSCVDAMVREKLLVNDDAANAEISYAQIKSATPGLEVRIEVVS